MVQKKITSLEKPLTPVELETMSALWELGEGTVKEVQGKLPKERALAYTTVATMMKILEQKGVVRSEKRERAHLFVPLISREDYAGQSLRQLTQQVFQKSPSLLVKQLLEKSNLSVEELKAIRALVNERLDE